MNPLTIKLMLPGATLWLSRSILPLWRWIHIGGSLV
jgi:hypothetical protein